MRDYHVYILTNYTNNVLYIGVTSDISKRMRQHKSQGVKSFSGRYKLYKLIYLERSDDITVAIKREKQLKNWRRGWKWNLIKESNPKLVDLSNTPM